MREFADAYDMHDRVLWSAYDEYCEDNGIRTVTIKFKATVEKEIKIDTRIQDIDSVEDDFFYDMMDKLEDFHVVDDSVEVTDIDE